MRVVNPYRYGNEVVPLFSGKISGTTSNATVTSLANFTVPDLSSILLTYILLGYETSTPGGNIFWRKACFTRNGAVVLRIGSADRSIGTDNEINGTTNSTTGVSGTTININGMGAAGVTYTWAGKYLVRVLT